MNTKFPLLSPEEIRPYLSIFRKENLSRRARNTFLNVYLNGGNLLTTPYTDIFGNESSRTVWEEREHYLRYIYPRYVHKPSYRMYLTLISWGFRPGIADVPNSSADFVEEVTQPIPEN